LAPRWIKRWFHVEHAPIQETPAKSGSLLEQAMQVGLNQLQWSRLDQLMPGCAGIPVQFVAQLIVLADHADSMQTLMQCGSGLRTQHELFAAVPHDLGHPAAAKALPTRKQMNRLQRAGFPRTIVTEQQVDARCRPY